MNENFPEIEVENIITTHKYVDGGWCWTKYNAGPYRGCSYDCAYCYNISANDGSEVAIKKDAQSKFSVELDSLEKDVITIGDYQPIEVDLEEIRAMLEIAEKKDFPIHINEKSPLVVRDLDIIKKISDNSWAAVSMSITNSTKHPKTGDDLKLFEKDTPTAGERFQAMREIANKGILTGTCCVPLIPYIGDDHENIEDMIEETKEAGGSYFILGSLVIPEPFDMLFWDVAERSFPEKLESLRELFDPANTEKFRSYFGELDRVTSELCAKYGLLDHIPRPVDHYSESLKDNKRLAETFFLKARFAKAENVSMEKEFSYMALGWLLEDIPFSIVDSYNASGKKALLELGLDDDFAAETEQEIEKLKS